MITCENSADVAMEYHAFRAGMGLPELGQGYVPRAWDPLMDRMNGECPFNERFTIFPSYLRLRSDKDSDEWENGRMGEALGATGFGFEHSKWRADGKTGHVWTCEGRRGQVSVEQDTSRNSSHWYVSFRMNGEYGHMGEGFYGGGGFTSFMVATSFDKLMPLARSFCRSCGCFGTMPELMYYRDFGAVGE